MSRRTVPILLTSIAVLFLALVAIIVLMLTTPERRTASGQRREAVERLFSRSTDPSVEGNLSSITSFVLSPVSAGGSLDNLTHFLSKDPGRNEFPSASDRRKAEKYLEGQASSGRTVRISDDAPPWAIRYLNSVTYLFDGVVSDILLITGYPYELSNPDFGARSGSSAPERTSRALELFAARWVPPGESPGTYRPDRSSVREYLLESRRFMKRTAEMDAAWNALIAELYNLSLNPRWKTAENYAPELAVQLEELTIVLHTADIFRRNVDIMTGVPDADTEPGEVAGPGIQLSPELSYYKNVPELTGYTADEVPVIYFARVSIAYTFRDSRTQTWLNRRKDWLSDYFQAFFSSVYSRDFSPEGEIRSQEDMIGRTWASARLKAEAIYGINENIVLEYPFGQRKVQGVRDLAFVRVNLLKNP